MYKLQRTKKVSFTFGVEIKREQHVLRLQNNFVTRCGLQLKIFSFTRY